MSHKSTAECTNISNILVTPVGKPSKEKLCGIPKVRTIPVCRIKPKAIRVCTGADLRRMCPPRMCDCSTIKPRGNALLSLLLFGLKAAIAAGAVYVTYDMGIWGTNDDSQNFYSTTCNIIAPTTMTPRRINNKWDPPSCFESKTLFKMPPYNPYGCDEPPYNMSRVFYALENIWNHSIYAIFSNVAAMPYKVLAILNPAEEETIKEKKPLIQTATEDVDDGEEGESTSSTRRRGKRTNTCPHEGEGEEENADQVEDVNYNPDHPYETIKRKRNLRKHIERYAYNEEDFKNMDADEVISKSPEEIIAESIKVEQISEEDTTLISHEHEQEENTETTENHGESEEIVNNNNSDAPKEDTETIEDSLNASSEQNAESQIAAQEDHVVSDNSVTKKGELTLESVIYGDALAQRRANKKDGGD